jgi:TolB-like protein
MSPEGANEYFSDGMTEEIMTALSKVEELRVAARTSAFAFKGKTESVSEIGHQLRVGTVLEGSVRREGDRLRITAQLINVKDGYHLWADAYDRDLRDVFAVQAEIAQAIVGALKVKLSGEATTMVVRRTTDLAAYDFYLKGRHAVNQRSGGSLVQAVAYFEQAIARDPPSGCGPGPRARQHSGGGPYHAGIRQVPVRFGLARGRAGLSAGDRAKPGLRDRASLVRRLPRRTGKSARLPAGDSARRGARPALAADRH